MPTPRLPDLAPLYARQDESDRVWREEQRIVDPSIAYEVLTAERAHLLAQDPVTYAADRHPEPGTIVLDADGDGWEFRRSRWTQISGNPRKPLRVAGITPRSEYSPYRVVGRSRSRSKPTEWAYRTVRPRDHHRSS